MSEARPDSLAGGRQWLVATAVFFAATWAFLWPAFLPWDIHRHLQTLDSVLMAWLMGHSSYSLLGPLDFWNAGMFHPIPDTLCLSDPMLTPAVIMAPFIRVLGVALAYNLWLWLCWFSMGLSTWAYLRHRNLGFVPALFGGLFIAFTPDRLFHMGGHAHLFFQASFPLVLLAVERAVRPRSSHWWGALFGAAVFLEVFSGFYLTLLFGMWCVVMVPASLWLASDGSRERLRAALRRQGPQFAAWSILAAVIFFPIANHYREFGRDFPTMNLAMIDRFAADWSGYLLPPTLPGKIRTISGSILQPLIGVADRGEDNQYLGIAAPMLLIAGLLLFWKKKSVPRKPALIWWMALGLLAILAFALSFGPGAPGTGKSGLPTPYGMMYAWLPPLRFFRAPSRFAFLVEWAIAFGAAYGLHFAMRALKSKARLVAAAAFLLLFIDFFPSTAMDQVSVAKEGLTEFLLAEEGRHAFAELPVFDEQHFLSQALWHYEPMANGYSGYVPQGRMENLVFLEADFPSAPSLVLLRDWGVDRVYISRRLLPERIEPAKTSPALEVLWEGEEGALFRVVAEVPSMKEYVALRRGTSDYPPGESAPAIVAFRDFAPTHPLQPVEMDLRQTGELERPLIFLPSGPQAAIDLILGEKPIHPAVYTHLRMRVRVDNWYDMNEEGSLYWATARFPQFGRHQVIHFTVPADGEFHDIDVDLAQSMGWNAEEPITRLRLQLGKRPGNEYAIEDLGLESE